jgi:purine-cytosine permease-like protein
LLAPLGLESGTFAILLGHLIGVLLLSFGGYVSFIRGENAMTSIARSFGRSGGALIATCNVIQLIGWTVIMVVQGSSALTGVTSFPFVPVALILSILVSLWALILGSPAGWMNDVAVILLSVLCVVLFAETLNNEVSTTGFQESVSMALAIELSITMPISWLPLIGDYSCKANDGVCASVIPFVSYFIGSTCMYSIYT